MAVLSPAAFNQGANYGAEQSRNAWFIPFNGSSGGIVNLSGGDLAMSAPVSGMSVNIATGKCLVKGTSTTTQGLYAGVVTSTTNLSIATPDPSNPRVDLVCATVDDKQYLGVVDDFKLQVLTGTPTSGATLSNLSGAPSLPVSSLLIGYVLVPANAPSITSGDLGDHRVQVALAIPPGSLTVPLSALSQSSATTGEVPVWNGSAWVAASTSALFATETASGSSGTLKVTGVPGTGVNLRINAVLRSTLSGESDSVVLRINGDSGSHYDSVDMYANNSAVEYEAAQAASYGFIGPPSMPAASATTGNVGIVELVIPFYASTSIEKIINYRVGWYDAVTGASDGKTWAGTCVWRSTAAITEVDLITGTGPYWSTISQMAVYVE